MKARRHLFTVLIGAGLVAGVLAGGSLSAEQDEPAEESAPASPVGAFIAGEKKARTGPAADASGPEDAVFELPSSESLEALGELDPELRDLAVQSMREYYRYRESGYKHRRDVFDWQLMSSKIIFWVVIILVAVSIYFSGVQFHSALRSRPTPATGEERSSTPKGTDSGTSSSGLQTSFEAGSGGIKVSSPVLGVIILVISLLFFYLYLVHIYPISEIW